MDRITYLLAFRLLLGSALRWHFDDLLRQQTHSETAKRRDAKVNETIVCRLRLQETIELVEIFKIPRAPLKNINGTIELI